MSITAKSLAEEASFQAFANCYLREIDSGVWHTRKDWQRETGLMLDQKTTNVLELQLVGLDITLMFGASYRATVGRHAFTCVYRQQENAWTWQAVPLISAITLLIDNIYAQGSETETNSIQKLELLTRTLDSNRTMREYLQTRANDPALLALNFIDSEQSLLLGHWLHPTPKSRQGMHEWQHKHYTPELQGHFQLHYFAISRQFLQQRSVVEQSVEHIINSMADAGDNLVDPDKQLVPVHPLQAQWLLHDSDIQQLIRNRQIIDLGVMGKTFTPTSSVRTLYCAELEFMIKLSIPVKITNSLRQNMSHELEPGLSISQLIDRSLFSQKYPQFSMIEDPAYLTVNLPNKKESGFETIIRCNPFTSNAPQATLSIAALVQNPIVEGTHAKLTEQVHALAKTHSISVTEASLRWFESYWDCAIKPAIMLYETQGVALEAHQQNSLLSITNNLPSHYYYRDNQGFYLSEKMREALLHRVPGLESNEDLFYNDGEIADRFGYYLFVNQLFSVIGRFGCDNLISEQALLSLAYLKLREMQPHLCGGAANLVRNAFERTEMPCKANLLTRVEDLDELQAEQELAVYSYIVNPFFALHKAETAAKRINEVQLASA